MPTTSIPPSQRPRGPASAALPLLLAVALLVLSSIVLAPSSGVGASPPAPLRSTGGDAVGPITIAAAERSLALGAGPAAGRPVTCTSAGILSDRCTPASISTLSGGFQARATSSPTGGPKPLAVHFVGSATGGVSPYVYTWDPGDGSANASGAYFNHTYTKAGTYRATVRVNDSSTNSSLVTQSITVTTLTWYDLPATAVQPPWMMGASMTYDPQINGILLFGGYEESYPYTTSDQTWEFVGGVWQNISTTLPVSPNARYGASLAYDANDSYALLFGGYSYTCYGVVANYTSYYCNDTWTFTPSSGWLQITPNVSPPGRFDAAMAYDPSDGYVVLFGGECACGYYYYGIAYYNDTWTFSGGQWTNASYRSVRAPPTLGFSNAVYDPAKGYLLLFGGAATGYGCPSPTGETWKYSLGNWTNLTAGIQPKGVDYGALTYDPALGEAVYFGGNSGRCSSTLDNKTWTFNGTWTDVSARTVNAPPPDDYTAMAYDEGAGAIVYLGNIGGYYGYYSSVQPSWTWPGPPMVTTTSIAPADGIAPFNVTFSANTTGGVGPYNDSWNFGDGSPNASGGTVTHTFASVANFTVTLTVNDSGGRIAITYLSVVGFPPLLAAPTSTGTLGEAPWAVHFYSNATGGVPPLTRSWTFGDGGSSTAASPLHTFATAGTYPVILAVRDASGAYQNWSDPVIVLAHLEAAPTDAPALGQSPLTVQFAAGASGGRGPYSFNWSFGDTSANGTISNLSHDYATVGTFTVGLEVRDGLGYDVRVGLKVTVTPDLLAAPSASPMLGIAPLQVGFTDATKGGSTPYTISWSFGDGTSPTTGPVAYHLYAIPGAYTAVESVTDAVGTVTQQTLVITVVAPLASSLDANASTAVRTAPVQFQLHPVGGEAPFQYSFNFGDGGTASGSAIANHTFTTSGRFEVRGTVTDGLRQVSTSVVNVTVVAPLVARISASPQTLVLGGTLNLSASSLGGAGPYAYRWTGLPAGCTNTTGSTISCVPTVANNFSISVAVSDRSGQNTTSSTWVLVTPAPSGSGGARSGASDLGSSVLWIVLALAAVVLVGAVMFARARRRAPPPEPEGADAPSEWSEGTADTPPTGDAIYDEPPPSG